MEKKRGILLGVGNIGRHHFRLLKLRDDINFIGFIDPLERVDFVLKQWKNLDDFVAENGWNIDFAVIATPIETHFDLAQNFLEHDVHVLLEKPICFDYQGAKLLMELAEQKQKVLQIGHSERFNPAFKVFQELMEANIVGDIYRMEINRSGPFPQQKINAGATIDLAVHDLEIVSRLMKNKKPLGVFAYSEKRIAKKFEDGITALFRFENEILVQITANWLSPRKNRYISVYGYKGLLHCDLFHQKVIFYENKHKRDKADEYGIGGIEEGAKVSYEVPKWEPLAAEHNEFFDNIAAGKNDTESLETASTAVYLANLVMKAANAETHQIKR